jgi:hypothetical protein
MILSTDARARGSAKTASTSFGGFEQVGQTKHVPRGQKVDRS